MSIEEDFRYAAALAEENKLSLRRPVPVRFELSLWDRRREWTLYLYPHRSRYTSTSRAPRIRLKRPWTLTDAVRAAVEAVKARQEGTS